MTRLEQRYRRVLRLLPASYREVWEEDMVAIFLASMHTDDPDDADYLADFGRPGWSEVASVVTLVIRLRIGTATALPRYAAWSEAVRLAVLGMLVNAAASVVGAAITLWLARMIPFAPAPILPEPPGYPDSWHRIHLFTAATTLASVVLTSVFIIERIPGESRTALSLMFFWCSPSRCCPPRAAAAHSWLLMRPTPPLPPLDPAGLESAAVLAVAAVYLAGQARHRFRRFSAWTPALAVIAFAVLGLRLVTLLDYVQFDVSGWHPATFMIGVAEAIALAGAAIMLALLSGRTLRLLPATAAEAAAWSTPTR